MAEPRGSILIYLYSRSPLLQIFVGALFVLDISGVTIVKQNDVTLVNDFTASFVL
jgi:hypothetical protein